MAKGIVTRIASEYDLRRGLAKEEIDVGLALNFGEMRYGNVGSETRLDFTVTGPAVNLAARIEALTRTAMEPVLL